MSRDWVGTSRIWKNFMQENFGLIFRSLFFKLNYTYTFEFLTLTRRNPPRIISKSVSRALCALTRPLLSDRTNSENLHLHLGKLPEFMPISL